MDGLKAKDHLEVVHFSPGEMLLREGEQSYYFFIIEEGRVEILASGAHQAEVKLAELGPGQLIGELAFVAKRPRNASARAITKGRAVRVSVEGYESLLKELPEWASYFISSLVERVSNVDEIIRKKTG